MFRRKKVAPLPKTSPLPQEEDSHEKEFSILSSSPKEEKEHPRIEEEKLRNTLYYLASLIPKEKSWKCYFVDSDYHEGDITRAEEGGEISIRATLTKETDHFLLLPFGDKPVWCSFPPSIEFSFSSSQGEGKLEAIHVCEKGIHKLLFPEEIKIEEKEYPLQRVLPLLLTHN